MQIAKIASPQQSHRWRTSSVRQKEHCSSIVVLNKRAVWNVFAVNARIADKSKHKKSQDDTEKKRGALQREVAVLKKARLHILILSPVWSLSKSWERLDLLFQLDANDRSRHRAPWSPAKILYRERNVNWKRKWGLPHHPCSTCRQAVFFHCALQILQGYRVHFHVRFEHVCVDYKIR